MIISLTTQTYSVSGQCLAEITPDSQLETISRRVSRTATLDGLSSLSDFGYTASDATLLIKFNHLDADQSAAIESMVKLYPLLILSCQTGCYLGAVSAYNPGITPQTLTFLVKQKLSS